MLVNYGSHDLEAFVTDTKGNIFGWVFQLSAKKGYDSFKFIEKIMTDENLAFWVYEDDCQEWAFPSYLLSHFEQYATFEKGDRIMDEFELWFMGYLYKWWMRMYRTKPAIVYENLPVEVFHNMFNFYHTQGWDYIVTDAGKAHLNGEW